MQLPSLKLLPNPEIWDHTADPRSSAVLALFVDEPALGPSLLFTRRAIDLRSHAGQVGFPGGRREVWDVNPAATALREAQEEIALDQEKVTLIGSLPPVRSLDGKPVIPVIGHAKITLDELIASPVEVAEIFLVPWHEFTREKKRVLRFNIFGKWRETPHYDALGHHVWGLTAWMIDRMELGAMSTSAL